MYLGSDTIFRRNHVAACDLFAEGSFTFQGSLPSSAFPASERYRAYIASSGPHNSVPALLNLSAVNDAFEAALSGFPLLRSVRPS